MDTEHIWLIKAEEGLAGAESEFANGRYNNTANRCYYACFQAAVYGLIKANLKPTGDEWSHEYVEGQFVGQLINRRKVYPTDLRRTISDNRSLRKTADYEEDFVTETRAARAIRRTGTFLEAVRRKESNRP